MGQTYCLPRKMNQLSELKMAVDATFSSILNEIQLSGLNFTIQVTPYSAYITLKKSSQKDPNGSFTAPSPPVLSLLQEAQHVLEIQKNEILELKECCALSSTKYDEAVLENTSLLDELVESKKAIEASDNTNNSLHDKLERWERSS